MSFKKLKELKKKVQQIIIRDSKPILNSLYLQENYAPYCNTYGLLIKK